ncbi:trypsin-like peptidase domain-containing protein [Actinotalea sp. BY-33]|uniref:Trypsin-like peptidase domain-containing protein n=1 Tax=Actinotalea soli TaxID=2819234 RepID=A0A939LSI4_9CELL|nr:trypsin-like peptidase domain-containing protein [Actinotalea soli]MBO1751890.1 trypsin-like peptidase domain-containing protein [Actinotalea soli]
MEPVSTENNPFAPPSGYPRQEEPARGPAPAPLSSPAAPAGQASPGPATSTGWASTTWQQSGTRDAPEEGVPGAPMPPLDSWGRPQPRPREQASRGLGAGAVVLVVVLALVAGALGSWGFQQLALDAAPRDVPLPVSANGERAPELTGVADIASQVLPSVVSIEVRGSAGAGTGSGFVLREDGYILTNNHVVSAAAEGGAQIAVLFSDGSEHPAELVGRTSEYDLAVLKVDLQGLTPLALADSDAVVVGDPVVAIGAPLGLRGTVTTGIVSALNRPVSAGDAEETAFINAIQTDAAINPGNSGGPLVDATGEVIGINSAIAQPPGLSATGGSIGLGFAIPSNQARRTAEELIETGTATYPVIGVLLDSRYTGEGVQVSTEAQQGQEPVTPDGPADRAGIQPGDVILAIDGRPVTEADELIVAIRAKAPGDAVVLTLRSEDEAREVRVVLSELSGG